MLTPVARLLLGLLVLGAVFVLGVSVDVAACFVFWNFYPLLVAPAYAAAALPALLLTQLVPPELEAEYAERVRVVRDFGQFATGVAVMYGLGMPAVLLHAGLMPWGAALMTLVGGVVMYAALYLYIRIFHRHVAPDVLGVDPAADDDDGMFAAPSSNPLAACCRPKSRF